MRAALPSRSASPARRISSSWARASAQIRLSLIAPGTARTDPESPGLATRNPASVRSTSLRSRVFAHRLDVAGAGNRQTGLDHVDTHPLQRFGDTQLLFARHRGAGTLLAVAHRRVEDNQT